MRNGLRDINLYRYDEVLAETENGIRLVIQTDYGIKAPWLPKKKITMYPHLNEVEIPEWLCLRAELIPVIEQESLT